MQTFFWPSVFALYVGTLLLALDLIFLEKFASAVWAKFVILLSMLVLTVMFTWSVVLRTAPISVFYRNRGDVLDVYISNDSEEDDYQALDIKMVPNPDKALSAPEKIALISSPEQITHVPGVSFVDALPSKVKHGEALAYSFDNEDQELPTKTAVESVLRFRCDELPAGTVIRFRMKIVHNVGREIIPLNQGINDLMIEGKMKGRFRVFHVKEKGSNVPQNHP